MANGIPSKKKRSRFRNLLGGQGDSRPIWKRYDAAAGLTLREAMIFYGPEFPARDVHELELCGYGGEGPMLVDEEGWPVPDNEEIRDFRIKSFRLAGYRRELESSLLRRLEARELYATGYTAESPLDRNASRIASDRWRILTAYFETSSATSALGPIVGILVYSERNKIEANFRFSEAEVRNWYVDWISKNAATGSRPSRSDDIAAAKERFGRSISRDLLRQLRRELAPADWKQFGRRKA